MKSQKKTPLDLNKEKSKHRKLKRKTKKSPKKSDHKHEYEDVIVKVNYSNTELYYLGYRCAICGFVSKNMIFWDDDGMINKEVIEKKYSHLDIVGIE